MTRHWLAALMIAAVSAATATSADTTVPTPRKAVSPRTLAAAQMILDQQLPAGAVGGRRTAGGANQGQQPSDNGPALVELIQQTVAPQTWDVNGGLGSIVYFGQRGVIVVRQGANGDVHQQVGNALQQMRRN